MLSLSELVPGRWYLIFVCEYCNTKYAESDWRKGKGELKPIIQSTCPACSRIVYHERANVKRHYEPQTKRKASKKK